LHFKVNPLFGNYTPDKSKSLKQLIECVGRFSGLVYAKSQDEEAEPIGPRGWMSPESMNKYLTEGKGFEHSFPCKIDHQSDIFQLGKVFWYIFQHNAPIGSVKESDFKIRNSKVYSIIKTMLNHSKSKRYKTIDEVIKLLKAEETKLLKTLEF
jgi:serine/threonine protein kinase